MRIPSKTFLTLFAVLIGLSFAIPDFSPAIGAEVQVAQEFQLAQSRKRPGLFERLFGPRKGAKAKKRAPVRKNRSTSSRKRSSKKRSAPVAKVVPVSPKDEDARKILVVGDFVATGAAWGLEQSLAEERKLAVVDRSEGSSGLARVDRYDWNKEILNILNEENPDVVVVAIGANDRQELRQDDQRFPIGSEEWEAIYVERVDGLIDTLKIYGRPFFWMGTPPMRGTTAMENIAYFNGLYRPRIEKAGGHYIDVWNGFTNASGQFITNGPDTDGQVRALRTGDGVNFSRAGKAKLAYYVERDIRRATGFGSAYVDLLASVTQSSTIEIGPDGKKRLVGPVISLFDPLPGAAAELAGPPDPVTYDPISGVTNVIVKPPETAPEDSGSATPQYRLVVKGEMLAPAAGRIDDFAWPPAARANQDFIAPEEVAAAITEDGEAIDGAGEGEATLTPISTSSE